jgi:queuosine precursor transporter
MKTSPLFVGVAAVFVTALVVSNIIAVKLVEISGQVFPAGLVIFPLSYLLGDVLTEVYGFRAARAVIWLGFGCNLVALGAIQAAIHLPAAGLWGDQEAYETTLGTTWRIFLASLAAYLVGEFANSAVLARMKILTRGRYLWTRTIGSTLVGEGLDSTVFITIAFFGIMPHGELLPAIVTQWLFKTVYETLATPFTYVVVNFLKRVEGVDAYDHATPLNPFLVSEP